MPPTAAGPRIKSRGREPAMAAPRGRLPQQRWCGRAAWQPGAAACIALTLFSAPLTAGTIGHYAGSSWPEQSVFTAPPGWYSALFYTRYQADRAKDASGETISSVNIGRQTVPVDANTASNSMALILTYGSDFEILGGRYGFVIAPSYGDTAFQTQIGNAQHGFEIGGTGNGLGDTFVMPLQLTWSTDKWDQGFQYGVWVPTGKYEAGSTSNVGLGFWSQNLRYSVAYYPNPERWRTALIGSVVWEWNGWQRGVDLKPGQSLTSEFALNHFFTPQWSAAVFGHGQWQVTDDTGAAARPGSYRVLAAGVQGNYNFSPSVSLYARVWSEFGARDRFEGEFLQLGLSYKFR